MSKVSMINPYVFPGIRKSDLPDFYINGAKRINVPYKVETITEAVSSVTGVTIEQMRKKDRKRYIVYARHLLAYFIKDYLSWSLVDIGQYIGGRDHTTVIHSCKSYEDLYETLDAFRDNAEIIKIKIEQLTDYESFETVFSESVGRKTRNVLRQGDTYRGVKDNFTHRAVRNTAQHIGQEG